MVNGNSIIEYIESKNGALEEAFIEQHKGDCGFQIAGLKAILKESSDTMIARSYVLEKLTMIENGGIGFHPVLKEAIEDAFIEKHQEEFMKFVEEEMNCEGDRVGAQYEQVSN